MTNDTSTLNGALQELGETMADNLTAQGVTASASDGLTTLANKVLTVGGGTAQPRVPTGNDTTKLDGALNQLGEQLANNLTDMGVTASASDGLTTLAGKILDIVIIPPPQMLFEDTASSSNLSSKYNRTGSVSYSSSSYMVPRGSSIQTKDAISSIYYNQIQVTINAKSANTTYVNRLYVEIMNGSTVLSSDYKSLSTTRGNKTFIFNITSQPFTIKIYGAKDTTTSSSSYGMNVYSVKVEEYDGN